MKRFNEAKNTADTILEQLRCGDISRFWSWGLTTPQYGTTDDGNYFLLFSVNGFLFKGKVKIILWGDDTYIVQLLNRDKSVKTEIKQVYCDTVADVVDRLVERPASKGAYDELIKNAVYKF